MVCPCRSLCLENRHSYHFPDTPPNAHDSDGGSSGTSAGDSQCSVSVQPSCASKQGRQCNPSAAIHQSNEEPGPDRDGGGLQAPTKPLDNPIADLPVLLHVNPRRGSTSGGDEIYLIVKNLPSTAVLYARFGSNIAPTVSSPNGSEPAGRKRIY